jgi:hypothetical protein
MNWNKFGRNRSWPNRGTVQMFAGGLKKTTKNVRIAGVMLVFELVTKQESS